MPKYAVLLRAVNLGAHQRVSMADLRKLLESLGYAGVATYLQSGNAVLTAPDTDPGGLERQIRKALAEECGVDTDVLVRSGPELAKVIADNPYPDVASQPKLLHAAFLSAQPDPARVAKLDPATYAPDEFRVGDRVLYLRYAVGSGRSKLNGAALGRLGVVATARNWTTVLALAGMTADDGG